MAKTRVTKEQRMNWRELPYKDWNVLTFQSYFSDMNREKFGSAVYFPMRNYSFEQGVLKRALTEHGAEVLRLAFDEAFRTYRPPREYPLLTAGFAISYRINALIPAILAEKAESERRETERESAETADYSALDGVW